MTITLARLTRAFRNPSYKALRKAHHHPGERRGTSQEIDDIEQALSRIKSPPRSKRALDTLYAAARLIE